LTPIPPTRKQAVAPGVNLTFVNGEPLQNNKPTNDSREKPFTVSAPYNLFPLTEDFLFQLEVSKKFDPPRKLDRYMNLMSSDDFLGFQRIHEVLMAKGDTEVSGGQWLKTQIESLNGEHGVPPRISLGVASIIYREIKVACESINMKWGI
jgi:hypothetical protein